MGLRWKKPTPWSLYKSSDLLWLCLGSAVGIGNFFSIPALVLHSGGALVLLLHLLGLVVFGATLLVGEFLWSRWLMKPFWQSYQVFFPIREKGLAWAVPVFSYLAVAFILPPYLMDMGKIFGQFFREVPQGLPVTTIVPDESTYLGNYLKALVALIAASACVVLPPRQFALAVRVLVVTAFGFWSLVSVGQFYSFGTSGLSQLLYWDNSKLSMQSITQTLGFSLFTLSAGFGVMYHFVFYASQAPMASESQLSGEDFWRQPGKFMSVAATIVLMDFFASILGLVILAPAVSELARSGFGGESNSYFNGRDLIFEQIPIFFSRTPFGELRSFLFFGGLFLAGLAAAVSILDIAIFTLCQELKWSRRRASLHVFFFGSLMLTLPLIPTLYNYMNIAGADVLLSISSLIVCYFVGWKMPKRAQIQFIGRGLILDRIFQLWRFSVRFVTPVFLVYYFFSLF